MGKKKSVFQMLLVQDLMWQTLILIGIAGFYGILYHFIKNDAMFFGELLFIMAIIYMPLTQSCHHYEQFLSFQFVRKRFYRYQVVLSIIRAVELAVFRTFYQSVLQEEFVRYFMEDEDIMEQAFYSVSFLELFVTNIGVITAFNLLHVVATTLLVNWTPGAWIEVQGRESGWSPQSRIRFALRKEKHPVIYTISKPLFVIMMGVVAMLLNILYQEQIIKPFSFRLAMMAGLAVLCIILYFVGERRFRPENI